MKVPIDRQASPTKGNSTRWGAIFIPVAIPGSGVESKMTFGEVFQKKSVEGSYESYIKRNKEAISCPVTSGGEKNRFTKHLRGFQDR